MKKIFLALVMTIAMIIAGVPAMATNDNVELMSDELVLHIPDGYHLSDEDPEHDVFNVSGRHVVVHGDFWHTGGTLIIGDGTLEIKGNYYMTSSSDGACSSVLEMLNDNGLMKVDGSVIIDTNNGGKSGAEFLKAGTLEVKGDFVQRSTSSNLKAPANFATTGSHKVVFSGDGYQAVTFEDPSSSHFTNLEVTNKSGQVCFYKLPIKGSIIGDIVSEYDIHFKSSELTLANQTLTAPAFIMDNAYTTLKLADGAMLEGCLYAYLGTVELIGKADITEDFRIIPSGSGSTDAIFKMQDEAGHLTVHRDFEINTSSGGVSGDQYLKAGILEVKGNFIQNSHTSNLKTRACFATAGSHKVILSGDGCQEINLSNPGSSYFTDLEVTNTSGEVLLGSVSIKGKLTGDFESIHAAFFYNSSFTLSEQTVETPNLYMYGTTEIKLADGAVIKGSLYEHSGTVELIGKAEITEDFRIIPSDTGSTDAIFKMHDEAGHLTVHRDFEINTSSSGVSGDQYLKAGILEVKGNFTQNSHTSNLKSRAGFATAGSHKVILSGDGYQDIFLSNAGSSYFTNLEVTNQSGEVSFEKVSVKGSLIGDFVSNYEAHFYNSSYTLSEQTVETPNLYMYGTTEIKLADGAVIKGSLYEHSGTVELIGKAEITEDFRIIPSGIGSTDAIFKMQDEAGHLTVHRDFETNTSNDGVSGKQYLKAGILEVKGNFTQESTGTAYYVTDGFATTGSHKVILSGDDCQQIFLSDAGNSYFTNLEVTNQSGEVSFEKVSVKGSLIGDFVSNYDAHIYNSNFTLSNQTIETPNLYTYGSTEIKLADGAVINGSLTEYYGTIEILGRAEITGDYSIIPSSSGSSSAILKMQDEAGYLTVGGSFETNTTNGGVSGKQYLKVGTLEVKGNFTQESTGTAYYVTEGFAATKDHEVILSGDGYREVYFEDPISSHFGKLIVENPEMTVFTSKVTFNEMVTLEDPFMIDSAEYYEDSGEIWVDVSFCQLIGKISVDVMLTIYDDNDRIIETRKIDPKNPKTEIFQKAEGYEGGYKIKAFCWKGGTAVRISDALSTYIRF